MTVREIPVFTEKDKARFWSKVDKTSSEKGCWLWTGYKKPNGYGTFPLKRGGKGRPLYSHRIAFILSGGVFNKGPLVLHGPCHNRLCCNPDHLYSGDKKQNEADRFRDGTAMRGDQSWPRLHRERVARGERSGARKHPERMARGERNGRAKLTAEKALEIRLRVEDGESHRSLSKAFGVSRSLIGLVANRKVWQHI